MLLFSQKVYQRAKKGRASKLGEDGILELLLLKVWDVVHTVKMPVKFPVIKE